MNRNERKHRAERHASFRFFIVYMNEKASKSDRSKLLFAGPNEVNGEHSSNWPEPPTVNRLIRDHTPLLAPLHCYL